MIYQLDGRRPNNTGKQCIIKPIHHFGVKYTIHKHPSTQFTVEYPPYSKAIRGDKGENLYNRLTGPSVDAQAFHRLVQLIDIAEPINVTQEE